MSARAAVRLAGPGAIVAVGVILGACSGRESNTNATTSTGNVASPIVGGAVDTTRPDVLLLRDDTLSGFRCTATLIAPNLVLTARHCVGKRAVPAATTLCRGDATDDGAQALPTYAGDVAAAPMYLSASPTTVTLARAVKIHDDNATTTCGHDLALIELDRNVAGITPSLLRRTPPTQGEALVPMGFGWTDRNATINATERMKGTTNVLALGPVVYSFKAFGDASAPSQPVAVAAGEIAVNGVTMTGDSGGPAFDGAGRLAAIVSRGYNDAYYGPGTFTTIAAHLATIDAALVASGNAPVADAGLADDASTTPGNDASPGGPGGPVVPPGGDTDASDVGSGSSGGSDGCSVTASTKRRRDDGRTRMHDGAAALVVLALGLARRTRRG